MQNRTILKYTVYVVIILVILSSFGHFSMMSKDEIVSMRADEVKYINDCTLYWNDNFATPMRKCNFAVQFIGNVPHIIVGLYIITRVIFLSIVDVIIETRFGH